MKILSKLREFFFTRQYSLFETIATSWITSFLLLTDYSILVSCVISFVFMTGICMIAHALEYSTQSKLDRDA